MPQIGEKIVFEEKKFEDAENTFRGSKAEDTGRFASVEFRKSSGLQSSEPLFSARQASQKTIGAEGNEANLLMNEDLVMQATETEPLAANGTTSRVDDDTSEVTRGNE